ncbi:TPA: hypothetical protein ACYKGI_001600 [Campylobacter coli]|nr:hypothetical protein [Campylobacter coli]
MQLSIRKKMLMLGAICFISMLATFAIFYYNNLKGSQKIAQTTKNLIKLKILDLKRIKADTFLSIKKQPSKPILLEKT